MGWVDGGEEMKLTDVVTPEELLKAVRHLREKRNGASADIEAARRDIQIFGPAVQEIVNKTAGVFEEDKPDHCATGIAILIALQHAVTTNQRLKA